jgi:hypothetical protein
LAAVTVKVEELPAVMEPGLALTLTVGGWLVVLPDWLAVHPARASRIGSINTIAMGEELEGWDRRARAFIIYFLLMAGEGAVAAR